MSKLIAFEGPDQCGKETQSKMLETYLRSEGYRVTRVEVPAEVCKVTYRLIYRMLRDGSARKHPNVFQFVQFLNKLMFQVFHLRQLLKKNDVVIFDRWSLSSVVYGHATNVNSFLVSLLFYMIKRADMTIVLNGRSFVRNEEHDDYEKDQLLQARVSKLYKFWVDLNSSDHVLVNNEGTIDAVHQRVVNVVERELQRP